MYMAKWQSKSSFFQQLLSHPWKTSQWITNVFCFFINDHHFFPRDDPSAQSITTQSSLHVNYSATYVRTELFCVWCKKKARCVRYLRPSVDFLGKNFPFIIVLFRFPFFHCISKRLRNSPYGFLTCVWNNRVLRSMKMRNIFIFSLLKLHPKKYWGITQDPIENISE